MSDELQGRHGVGASPPSTAPHRHQVSLHGLSFQRFREKVSWIGVGVDLLHLEALVLDFFLYPKLLHLNVTRTAQSHSVGDPHRGAGVRVHGAAIQEAVILEHRHHAFGLRGAFE